MEMVGRPGKCPWVWPWWGLCSPGLQENGFRGSAGSQGQGDGGREPHHVGLKEGWGREGSKSVLNRGEQIMEPSHPPAVSGAFLSRPLWSVFSLHLPEGQRQAVLKMLCLLRLE